MVKSGEIWFSIVSAELAVRTGAKHFMLWKTCKVRVHLTNFGKRKCDTKKSEAAAVSCENSTYSPVLEYGGHEKRIEQSMTVSFG